MRIGIDITNLLFCGAGLYRYTYNLIENLVKISDEDIFKAYYCNYRFARRFLPNPQEMLRPAMGHKKNVGFTAINAFGLPSAEQRLQKLSLINVPQFILRSIDSYIINPINYSVNMRMMLVRSNGEGATQFKQLNGLTEGLDVIHHSEQFFFYQPRLKHVITIHDLSFLAHPNMCTNMTVKVFKSTLEFAKKRCHIIIVPSHFTKQELLRLTDIGERKIKVIHSAASNNFRPIDNKGLLLQVLNRYGLTLHAYILYVGTIEPRKNLIPLLSIAKALSQYKKSLKIVLAGKYGWRFKKTRKVIRLHKENIAALGYVPEEDLPFIINGAIMLVCPSLYEGFGFPPLEAMACGVPVVVSKNTSMEEIVKDAGILIDPLDKKQLQDAVITLIKDEKLRRKLSRKGLEKSKFFSWEKTAKETLDVYHNI